MSATPISADWRLNSRFGDLQLARKPHKCGYYERIAQMQ